MPLLRLGTEWRPLERLGVSVWAEYRFLTRRDLVVVVRRAYIPTINSGTRVFISEEEVGLGELVLPKAVVNGSISFNF